MFGAAIWAKMGRLTIGMVGLLFLLVLIQPFFVDDGTDVAWLRALHVVNALLIFMLGYHLTQRAGPIRMPREG
jgi:hypothetical protein